MMKGRKKIIWRLLSKYKANSPGLDSTPQEMKILGLELKCNCLIILVVPIFLVIMFGNQKLFFLDVSPQYLSMLINHKTRNLSRTPWLRNLLLCLPISKFSKLKFKLSNKLLLTVNWALVNLAYLTLAHPSTNFLRNKSLLSMIYVKFRKKNLNRSRGSDPRLRLWKPRNRINLDMFKTLQRGIPRKI